jgi:hypothetical protein
MRMHITPTHKIMLGVGLVVGMSLRLASMGSADVTAASNLCGSTPVIDRVAPATPTPGATPHLMTVTGKDFQPRLTLKVTSPGGSVTEFKDGLILEPRESSFRVSVVFATTGRYVFVVTNPDGGVSDPFTLEVRAVTKAPSPIIERIRPDEITKNPEPQNLTVNGREFGPGLRAIVTDPMGMEVLDPLIRELTPTSFTLNVKLETAGNYSLVVHTAAGTVSTAATIVVR